MTFVLVISLTLRGSLLLNRYSLETKVAIAFYIMLVWVWLSATWWASTMTCVNFFRSIITRSLLDAY